MAQRTSRGMIVREREPVNLEFPYDELRDLLTPNESFYVRSHFTAPDLEPANYRLTIDGAVERPFNLTFHELCAMPVDSVTATLECAGNSRVFLVPQQNGAQWELGAVGTAEWTGVRLSRLLERAGIKAGVCEIVLEGADRGEPKEKPKPPQPISFARSIPLPKALQPEVLLAFQMNGEKLTRDHGFPVRAIVPGHYGMASIKWLTRVEAVEEPFQGYWQTSEYAYWDSSSVGPVRRPLSRLALKSAIARPRMYETIPANQPYTVFGAAWSGAGEISEIEVSTDQGNSWAQGTFLDEVRPFTWRRWNFDWLVPDGAGQYVILSRARDSSGNVQPTAHDSKYGNYVVHHTLPIQIFVK